MPFLQSSSGLPFDAWMSKAMLVPSLLDSVVKYPFCYPAPLAYDFASAVVMYL